MTMQGLRVAAAVILAGCIAAALAAAGSGAGAGAKVTVAEVVLAPTNGSGVRGAALFRQQGRRVSGWVVVWGLAPRQAHAVHVHGPGRCGRKAPPVAAHADLVAAVNGVAFTRFRTVSAAALTSRRFYYNVHARPATVAENPEIACGNLVAVR